MIGQVKCELPAYDDMTNFPHVETVLTSGDVTYVCHIRKRSSAPVDVTNCHPFVQLAGRSTQWRDPFTRQLA
jgi:predicted glutamine amidotransferase